MTDRRSLLRGALGVAALTALALPAGATPAEVTASIAETFGDGAITPGPITLEMPALAETGNSVPVTIRVDSPMSADDRVLRIVLFAESNPLPRLIEAHFGPAAAEAVLTTNIRLNGTQTVTCIAETADGRLWQADHMIRVVVGACTTLSSRY